MADLKLEFDQRKRATLLADEMADADDLDGYAFRFIRQKDAHEQLVAALRACQLQLLQSNNTSEYAQEANDLARAALRAAGEEA